MEEGKNLGAKDFCSGGVSTLSSNWKVDTGRSFKVLTASIGLFFTCLNAEDEAIVWRS